MNLRCLCVFAFAFLCPAVFSQDLHQLLLRQVEAMDSHIRPPSPDKLRKQQQFGSNAEGKYQNPGNSIPKPLPARLSRQLHSPPGGEASCSDTSLRLIYSKPDLWVSNDYLTKLSDGNILIPGWDVDPVTSQQNAHLIKCNQFGDTIWTKTIEAGYPRVTVDLYKAFELADHSILVAGNILVPMPTNGRYDPMLIRLTPNGDLIWHKTYRTRLWKDTTTGSIDILGCTQDANGDIYLAGDIRTDAAPRLSLSCKMDMSGKIIWSNSFTRLFFPVFEGIDVIGNQVTFFGRHLADKMFQPVAIVMDKTTGDSLRTVAFASVVDDQWLSFSPENMVKLNNGNIVLSGPGTSELFIPDLTHTTTHAGWLELTPDLKFVRAGILRATGPTHFQATRITFFKDGSGAYQRENSIDPFHSSDVIYGSFNPNRITKERSIHYRGKYTSWFSNFIQLDDGGQATTTFFGSDAVTAHFEYLRLHDTDTAGACVGSDTVASFIEPQVYVPHNNLDFGGRETDILEENQRPFKGVFNGSYQISSPCKQVSLCDTLALSTPKNIVCVNTPVTLKLTKNKACGATPFWTYDASVVSAFTPVNDSLFNITFNRAWEGNISAFITGCKVLGDSVKLTVLQAPAVLNLGTDTALCPGNTVRLNAGKGYASYRWQDGSTDSVLLVTKPSTYHVEATTACGDRFRDTVVVKPRSATPIDIGPDLTLCEKDSVRLSAPGGFTSYRWSAGNTILGNSKTVMVSPLTSGWFGLVAEAAPGCTVADSVYITVKKTPVINLGNDTSFCASESLLLQVGNGYDSYAWSTGAGTKTIVVNQPGSYWAQATLDGCTGRDTLTVLQVSPLPDFTLGNDTSLCEKQTLAFTINLPQASYTWSTGSTANKLLISQAGTYWLRVNQQGCSKADTVTISYKPLPIVHIGRDTTLCEEQVLKLNAASPGAFFQWQDGSHAAGFDVSRAGTYYVAVEVDHCTASDTIVVNYKSLPRFTLGADTALCLGQEYVLAPAVNTPVDYRWQDGSAAPRYTILKEGVYTLQVSNECGTFTDAITVIPGLCDIQMPTAFTPNHDGLNDLFRVKYPFAAASFAMKVYNRFGELIFSSTDMRTGWDGTYKGGVIPGAYVWSIQYTSTTGEAKLLKGTVILVK